MWQKVSLVLLEQYSIKSIASDLLGVFLLLSDSLLSSSKQLTYGEAVTDVFDKRLCYEYDIIILP